MNPPRPRSYATNPGFEADFFRVDVVFKDLGRSRVAPVVLGLHKKQEGRRRATPVDGAAALRDFARFTEALRLEEGRAARSTGEALRGLTPLHARGGF